MNRRIRDPYVRWCERRTSSEKSGEAVYSIIASVFFFVRCFVDRFCRALGQTHSLPSFGWCGLAMCVAVHRLDFYFKHPNNSCPISSIPFSFSLCYRLYQIKTVIVFKGFNKVVKSLCFIIGNVRTNTNEII